MGERKNSTAEIVERKKIKGAGKIFKKRKRKDGKQGKKAEKRESKGCGDVERNTKDTKVRTNSSRLVGPYRAVCKVYAICRTRREKGYHR